MESRLARFFLPERMQALKQEALESTFYGIPICEMADDDILVTLGALIERLDWPRRDGIGDLSGESRGEE